MKAEELDEGVRTNLESIIIAARPKEKRIVDKDVPLGKFLLTEYFTSNMKERKLHEIVDGGAEQFNVVAGDYFFRFRGSMKNGEFISAKREEIICYFADLLDGKSPSRYSRRSKARGFGITDIEADIVVSEYLVLLSDKRSKDLLAKAENMNDLKSIMLVDSMLPYVKHHGVDEILDSDMNPEQVFVKLARICGNEKLLGNLDDYVKQMEKVTKEFDIFMEIPLSAYADKLSDGIREIKGYAVSLRAFNNKHYNGNVAGFFTKHKETMKDIKCRLDKKVNETISEARKYTEPTQLSGNLKRDLKTYLTYISRLDSLNKVHSAFGKASPKIMRYRNKLEEQKDYLLKVKENYKKDPVVMPAVKKIYEKLRAGARYVSYLPDWFLIKVFSPPRKSRKYRSPNYNFDPEIDMLLRDEDISRYNPKI